MFGWDHNAFYHRLLLRHVPRPCARVLDVGCGAGAFAVELARRADRVDAVDRSPQMIALARAVVPDTVTCTVADILELPLPPGGYDAIVSVTALHHMPLDRALPHLAAALRPGGVLAAVALPRVDLPRELPMEFMAAIAHRLFGVTFAVLRRIRGGWFAIDESRRFMPVVLDPTETTRDVRRQARALLPGVQVRRLVFWRYLVLWRKPMPADAMPADAMPADTMPADPADTI